VGAGLRTGGNGREGVVATCVVVGLGASVWGGGGAPGGGGVDGGRCVGDIWDLGIAPCANNTVPGKAEGGRNDRCPKALAGPSGRGPPAR
jgi:hypothetical protein